MQDSFITSMANWTSILGCLISVGTLLMALNIRKKVEQSLRRKQFQQQRGRILTNIKQIRSEIYDAQEYDRLVKDYPSQTILDMREQVLQLVYFRLWRRSEERRMQRFATLLAESTAAKPKKYTAKDMLMALDEIIAIVESHAEL